MILQDFLGYGESKPCSFTARCKKRLKYFLQIFGRYARSGITNEDLHGSFTDRCFDTQAPSVGHGVEGILDHVYEYLFERKIPFSPCLKKPENLPIWWVFYEISIRPEEK